MPIDTLILSGGSSKGIAYLGVIKNLIYNKFLDFNKLKHVICASVGCIIIIPFLLKISIEAIYKILINLDVKLFCEDNFNIHSFIKDFGCFENGIEKYIRSFCFHFIKNENITLKEFYKITKIKYTVKVSNVSKKIFEYINHENYPDMPLVTLVKMATAVPLILKPVEYNGNLYSDGASNVGLPIEYLKINNLKKNYLAIILSSRKNKKEFLVGTDKKINNLYDYLYHIYDLYHYNNELVIFNKNKYIISIYLDKRLDFNISLEEKKRFILEGYIQTDKHVKKYLMT